MLTEMLSHLQDEPGRAACDFQGVEDGRKVVVELDVDHGTDDGHDASGRHGGGGGGRCDIVPAWKSNARTRLAFRRCYCRDLAMRSSGRPLNAPRRDQGDSSVFSETREEGGLCVSSMSRESCRPNDELAFKKRKLK